MKLNDLLVITLQLFGGLSFAQPSNDNCSNAERLCPNVVLSGTTADATIEGPLTYDITCVTPSATIWYLFTTNSTGGAATISFSNLTFNLDPEYGQQLEMAVFSASTPCSTPYDWIPGCGQSGIDFSWTNNIAAPLAPNTTYYVLVNGEMGLSQAAECNFDISISGPAVDKLPPTASINAINTTLCFGDTEMVEATISNCADTSNFEWFFDNVLISSANSATFNAGTLTGSGYLNLVVSCDLICTQTDTTNSIYFDVTPVSANAGPDKFISEGGQTMLDGSGDGVPSWTPGTSLTNSSIFTPIATPEFNTIYFLTVTNDGCTATDSVNVFVGEIITVFSTFTPNDDNINDKWVIRNSDQFENIEIHVYDRSGQRVFHATTYDTPDKWWDGTFKGKPLPASTYFYVIDLKEGEDPIYKGSVTIIR